MPIDGIEKWQPDQLAGETARLSAEQRQRRLRGETTHRITANERMVTMLPIQRGEQLMRAREERCSTSLAMRRWMLSMLAVDDAHAIVLAVRHPHATT